MKEQNYKHPTKEELDNIIKEANIKEPIEELLKMIQLNEIRTGYQYCVDLFAG